MRRCFLTFLIYILHAAYSQAQSDRTDSYVLYAPLASNTTYLLDANNEVVKTWKSDYQPGMVAYLLDDGSLLRPGMVEDKTNIFYQIFEKKPAGMPTFNVGGIIELISPDNEVTWRYELYSDTFMPHHDLALLPNGNILLIGWERKSKQTAIAAGRDPATVSDKWGLWVDAVYEVKPTGPTSGDIVWKWQAWNHLVQDFDSSKANYGIPADNPGKLDINYWKFRTGPADMMHTNAVDYIPERDQIIISSYAYSEIYIIDHSTTTAEAASDTGGRHGMGGRFLYRWGNPEAYGHKGTGIVTTGAQHDANWHGGTQSIWLYNNNSGGRSSYIFNIKPTLDAEGVYQRVEGGAYQPVFPRRLSELGFDAEALGTARELPSGALFSCDCMQGRAISLFADGTIKQDRVLAENIDDPTLKSEQGAYRILAYERDHPGIKALLD